MNVCSQSKSRPPGVFVFNPLVEARIAGGKGFSPTKHQAQMVRDLANLPQFLCRQDDIVLVPKRPSVDFLSGLKRAGFALPEFVEDVAALGDRKLGGLRPWAWGPDSVELLQPLFANVTSEARPAEPCFNDGIAKLYSKAWSAAFLGKFLAEHGPEFWLCTPSEVGVTTDSFDATLAAITAIRARGHHPVVLKQAIGVAGGSAGRLFEPQILDSQKRWIEKILAAGQSLVVEPWLDRRLDFSVQLEMLPGGLTLRGYTGLINDPHGQFRGNWAEPEFERMFPASVMAWFGRDGRIQNLYAQLFAALEAELRRLNFLGPVGIDALAYQNATGEIRLKPVVEINPRYTMGRVTVELMKTLAPGSFGVFRLYPRARLPADCDDSFAALEQRLHAQFPLSFSDSEPPKLNAGAVCLNDPAAAEVCLAALLVCRQASELQGLMDFASGRDWKASR